MTTSTIPCEYFSELPIATFIITADHEVIFWSKACSQLTAVNASQVLNTRNHWGAFYDSNRPCLADIVIDENFTLLSSLYDSHNQSKLSLKGICAEGWFHNLGGNSRHVIMEAAPIMNDDGVVVAAIETIQDITHIKEKASSSPQAFPRQATNDLIPICSGCKDIRNPDGNWVSLERFFHEKSNITFSHGICPGCIKRLYPDIYDEIMKK